MEKNGRPMKKKQKPAPPAPLGWVHAGGNPPAPKPAEVRKPLLRTAGRGR